jgi:hypothetical protein
VKRDVLSIIMGIHRFLSTIKGLLSLSTWQQPELYRQGDAYIMDLCHRDGIAMADLRRLNRRRLYFQVAQLSNITMIAGAALYPHVLPLLRETQAPPRFPNTKLQWPRQPQPGQSAHQLWKRTITRLLLRTDGGLRQPLGTWHQAIDG